MNADPNTDLRKAHPVVDPVDPAELARLRAMRGEVDVSVPLRLPDYHSRRPAHRPAYSPNLSLDWRNWLPRASSIALLVVAFLVRVAQYPHLHPAVTVIASNVCKTAFPLAFMLGLISLLLAAILGHWYRIPNIAVRYSAFLLFLYPPMIACVVGMLTHA